MSEIKVILSKYKTIAMIGVSKDLTKTSTIVMKYMQKYGFKVIPVNPKAKGEKILGEEVFEKITDIKEPVEIVDVFRPSKEASLEGLKTSTISTGSLISVIFSKTSSPNIFSPFAFGLTGITLNPYFCIYFITIVEVLVRSLLTPIIAIVLYFERITFISDINYLFFLIWSSQNFRASSKSVILDSDNF